MHAKEGNGLQKKTGRLQSPLTPIIGELKAAVEGVTDATLANQIYSVKAALRDGRFRFT
ncbi:MAG TPA: hypothetical protein VGK74_00140 [Symbiobacteriaceae bacterium]|jgi:hypothetical protein